MGLVHLEWPLCLDQTSCAMPRSLGFVVLRHPGIYYLDKIHDDVMSLYCAVVSM